MYVFILYLPGDFLQQQIIYFITSSPHMQGSGSQKCWSTQISSSRIQSARCLSALLLTACEHSQQPMQCDSLVFSKIRGLHSTGIVRYGMNSTNINTTNCLSMPISLCAAMFRLSIHYGKHHSFQFSFHFFSSTFFHCENNNRQ